MYDLAFCIPSLNEASTIGGVTRRIDAGIRTYYPHLNSVIVNADSGSADRTSEIFLATETATAKLHLPVKNGAKGKGENLANFFAFVAENHVRAAATLDGDLESITPQWIQKIVDPVLDGTDFVFPVYTRYRYDGVVTSQLCYPLLYGIFGVDIRQPIGGDFGFSGRFVRRLSEQTIPRYARGFGIDIYLTLMAIQEQWPYCGVSLGRKIHRKRDRATLGPMVVEVATTLFSEITRSGVWSKEISAVEGRVVFNEAADHHACPPVPITTSAIEQLVRDTFPTHIPHYKEAFSADLSASLCGNFNEMVSLNISAEQWCDALYALLRYSMVDGKAKKAVAALVPLFFTRVLSFVKNTKGNSEAEVEQEVREQARIFFEKRSSAL